MRISIETSINKILPACKLGYLIVDGVSIREADPDLDAEFQGLQQQIMREYTLEALSGIDRLAAVRAMYKKLKIDPARYRPSSEALIRRVLQNKGLYRINTAVDINNYCSVKFLLPFGLYDASHITGDVIFTISEQGSYLNIAGNEASTEGKPFLADKLGVFGNPTSDSRRTSVTLATPQLLSVVYSDETADEDWLRQVLDYTAAMLIRYNGGCICEKGIITA